MDTELNIVVSAQDESAAALDEVSTNLEGIGIAATNMAESWTASQAELTTAMTEFDAQSTTMATEFDTEMAAMSEAAAISSSEIVSVLETEGVIGALLAVDDEVGITKGEIAALGGVALIAFMGIKKQVTDAVGDAQTWNQSLALINAELKATGESIPIDTLTAYATQVQNTTNFSDQQALAAEATILSNKGLASQWQTMMPLAEDLATKMNTTLPKAASELAAAMTNPADEMKKLVNENIAIDPAMQRTILALAQGGDAAGASAILIDTLKNSIGGAAQTAEEAPGAGLIQFQNSLGTLNRMLGDDMLPTLDGIVKDIKPIVEGFTAWSKENPTLAGGLDLVALALSAILTSMLLIGIAITPFTKAWEVVWPVLVVVAGYATDLVVALGFVGTAGLGAALVLLYTYVQTNFSGNFLSFFKAAFDGLTPLIQTAINMVNGLIQSFEQLWATAKGMGGAVGGAAMGAVNSIGNFVTTHLAEGGIVSSPTVALIGEAGPEAVIPLSMLGSGSSGDSIGNGGGNGGIYVNISGTVMSTQAQATLLGNMIAKQINQQLKLKSW